jgi:hypothetical protein
MYIMPTSTASDATRESAQSDFSHSLQEFRNTRKRSQKRGFLREHSETKKLGAKVA